MTYDFDTPIDRSGTYSLKWEEAGDALPHRLAVRRDLWRLGDDGNVRMRQNTAARLQAGEGVAQEDGRIAALPALIRRRKMLADVAVAERAEDGVGQRVETGIGIGVTEQSLLVGNVDPADDALAPFHELVDIEPLANAERDHRVSPVACQRAHSRSEAVVILWSRCDPGTSRTAWPNASASPASSVGDRSCRDGSRS